MQNKIKKDFLDLISKGSGTEFRLTDFTGLKGWGCKIPKNELVDYLSHSPKTLNRVFDVSPDCYIKDIGSGKKMISSIDYFYPLHDNPFRQGQITVCNVLSDIYSMGVTNIDHFLVILGLSTEMDESERKQTAVGIMQGMEDKLTEAGTIIAGGQTVFNPWVTTGGSVTGFHDSTQEGFELFSNRECEPGDVLVLTKPVGTQLAINFAQYLSKSLKYGKSGSDNPMIQCEYSRKIYGVAKRLSFFTPDYIETMTSHLFEYMSDLNLYASLAMQTQMKSENVKACTDVTGFGLKGHAENLVFLQNRDVDFVFDKFLTFDRLNQVDQIRNWDTRVFNLIGGYTPESSGGLLVVMNQTGAEEYIQEMKEKYQRPAWIVGRVIQGSRKVHFNYENMEVINAPSLSEFRNL